MALVEEGQEWINSRKCASRSGCSLAVGMSLNQRVLTASLEEGRYQLVLFRISETTPFSPLPCLPFSLDTLIYVDYPAPNWVNCPATRLPESLNSAGYLSTDGFLLWDGNVYLPPVGQLLYSTRVSML